MTELSALEKRLIEVEDRLAIRELVSRYGFAIDDRDLVKVADLFTENAWFGSLDGVMGARGRAAIVEQFKARYSVLGATQHVAHDHVIEFQGAARATGMVSSHAEAFRSGKAMVTAIRYNDKYEKEGARWRFAERRLAFMYYLPVDEYAAALGRLDRNRAGAAPVDADYPEKNPAWKDYPQTK